MARRASSLNTVPSVISSRYIYSVKLFAVLSLLLLFRPMALQSQGASEIEGRILDATTKEPVQFVNVYNTTSQKGTISNIDGYFRITIGDLRDSILVIFIGYKTQAVKLRKDVYFYTIYFEESLQLLNEIVVTPKEDTYLIDLLEKCKKNSSDFKSEGKAYFELKTYRDNAQMELLEGYANVEVFGYELSDLSLKAGRVALQPYENRLFASLESSRVVARMKLWNSNPLFPLQPLTLTKWEVKRNYDLYLDKQYIDESSDSIYVIDYDPREANGKFFQGQIWVNKTRNTIIKITMNCPDARRHPFLPLFKEDSIARVNFMITKTFVPREGEIAFHHIDFTYTVDYKSRTGQVYAQAYSVKTQAILYVYDYDHPFILPRFDLADSTYGDYRRINAMPYNDFFWTHHDEYRLNDDANSNEVFFTNVKSITNKEIFRSNMIFKKGLFEQPFIKWSDERILLKPKILDTAETPDLRKLRDPSISLESVKTDKYKLVVCPFLDINTYGDSTDFLSAVIMDPYRSFYHLYQDDRTHCFINIYFDICEIERRKFMEHIRAIYTDQGEIERAYRLFINRLESLTHQYQKEVDRGTKEVELKKWNGYVKDNLGIDNIAYFNPYEKKK
jgi:hypothetical protein